MISRPDNRTRLGLRHPDLGSAAGIVDLTPGQGGAVEQEGVLAAHGLAVVVAHDLHSADFHGLVIGGDVDRDVLIHLRGRRWGVVGRRWAVPAVRRYPCPA